jgi:hypothetical protein
MFSQNYILKQDLLILSFRINAKLAAGMVEEVNFR